MEPTQLTIEYRDPADLIPDKELDAIHPIDEKAPEFTALCDSVARDGILDPLHIGPDNHIWCGRRRYLAAKEYQLKSVPVIVHTNPDDRELVMFTDEVFKRDGSTSARVWRTRSWWMQILERSKRVVRTSGFVRKSLVQSFAEISAIGPSTLLELSEISGIDRDEFSRCQRVMALFAEHPEAQEKHEAALLAGKISFWAILSGDNGGEGARKKLAGKSPAEFRGAPVGHVFKTMTSIGVRLGDWEDLTKDDRKQLHKSLVKKFCEGRQRQTPEQIRGTAAMLQAMAEEFEAIAKVAETGILVGEVKT